MSSTTRAGGRPREFDPNEALDRSISVFWRNGFSGTTTRALEAELGMTQSSIYNAFGSKADLMERGLDRYEEMLDQQLVGPLEAASSAPHGQQVALAQFVSDLLAWVGQADRRGCMLLNLLGETGETKPAIVARAARYRDRLRQVFVESFRATGLERELAAQHAEVLLASVLGLNIAARGGASREELEAIALALNTQIGSWTNLS